METPTHQEWRARQRLNTKAIWQTALFVGGILFIMSGGSPWSTAGTMNAAMGRDLPLSFFALLLIHMAIAYVYVFVIASVVYRLQVLMALFAGLGVGAILYLVNFASFHGLSIHMQSPEFRAILVHIVFALFASLVYKAASVPQPFRGGDREVANATQMWLHGERHIDDPEPTPIARHA